MASGRHSTPGSGGSTEERPRTNDEGRAVLDERDTRLTNAIGVPTNEGYSDE
jgi:hypothetical protein